MQNFLKPKIREEKFEDFSNWCDIKKALIELKVNENLIFTDSKYLKVKKFEFKSKNFSASDIKKNSNTSTHNFNIYDSNLLFDLNILIFKLHI